MAKRVLVTGASRGIGRAIALKLAADGFDISVHCRSGITDAEGVISQIRAAGGSARLLCFDISDRDACREALEADLAAHGAYWGLVLNAGIARDHAFPAMPAEDWDAVLHTNLDGFYNVVHPLTLPMVRAKAGGRIVTLSSVSGMMGNRGQVNYSAAKAGLIGASKALALELASRKITVNCIAPGLINTEMLSEVELDEALKLVPMKRIGEPEEIAGLVSYLFSDSAGYLTRQVIAVNGGMA